MALSAVAIKTIKRERRIHQRNADNVCDISIYERLINMTVIIDEEELPQGYTLKFKVEGITFLAIKRGNKRNAKRNAVKVYSDTDHTIVADVMQEYEAKQISNEQQLIPQFDF